MIARKKFKNTLTPFELDYGDIMEFTLANGQTVKITLLDTGYAILATDLESFEQPVPKAKTVYSFYCKLEINGQEYKLERFVPTQGSFYEPWEIDGAHIWFDAISGIFADDNGFLIEKDAGDGIICKPNKKARFAIQDASISICPDRLHPWFPLPEGGLRIEDCYRGEDCWMGTYDGIRAHGGLDVNHAVGTPLWAPFDLDDQYYFNSLKTGHNNNRWRGIRTWENGSKWIIQAHHMTELTVPVNTPIKKGQQFAKGAGVWSGDVDHTHLVFKIIEDGQRYFLDPWVLIWQMYKDKKI